MKNIKSGQGTERDIAALNIVFQNDKRFYIRFKDNEVLVWDKLKNELGYNFGSIKCYLKLITEYAQLPYKFD